MDLEKAKVQLQKAASENNWREVARLIGSPVDPREPVNNIIKIICDIEPAASPDEYGYYFTVDEDVKYVYTLDNTGTVTKRDVTLNTPNLIAFLSRQSPAYKVHIVDLNNAKYDVLGKKKLAITRAMDNEEVYRVLQLFWAGTPLGNQFTLGSGNTYFKYPKLVDMLKVIAPYGKDLVLVCGSTVYTDLITTDYNENKNQSVLDMIAKLQVKVEQVVGTVTIDGGQVDILDPDYAVLVATKCATGKPAHFQRKNVVKGVAIGEQDAANQRLISAVPVIPRNTEAPSVAVWGYGEYQASLENSKAIARFERIT